MPPESNPFEGPGAWELEKTGHGAIGKPALDDRITLTTDAELALGAGFDVCLDSVIKTEKNTDVDSISDDGQDHAALGLGVLMGMGSPLTHPATRGCVNVGHRGDQLLVARMLLSTYFSSLLQHF